MPDFLRLSLCIFCLALTACSKPDSVTSLDKDGLTALVFKDWKPAEKDKAIGHPVVRMDKERKDKEQMKLRPLQVHRLGDDRAVLLLAAEPVIAGHSTPGVLGAYWFKRTDGRWSLDKRQDEVGWMGIFGRFHETEIHELWPGHFALAVYWYDAGGGQESKYLSLFKLDEQAVTAMIKEDSLLLDTSTEGTQGCEERMQQVPGKKIRKRWNDVDTPPVECHDLKSTWVIKKGQTTPGELIIDSAAIVFTNKEIGHDADQDGETYTNYDFTALASKGKQVFRYDAATGLYQRISGKSLLHYL